MVAGASGSIGRQICEDLIKDGHGVIGTYFLNDRVIDKLPEVNWSKVNFADLAETRQFYERYKDIDAFIYAAGIAPACLPGSGLRLNSVELMTINLLSPILGANIFIPIMLERQFGRIIFFGSVVAKQGGVGLSYYAASKSGIIGAVTSLNRDIRSLKHKNYTNSDLTINSISPGYVLSDMTKEIPHKIKAEIERKSTLNRFLQTKDISRMVSFLLSESSDGISGANFEVNGGVNL